MSQDMVNKMPNRHIVILLLAIAFVLTQCIIELIIISFLITISPVIGTFLYSSKWIPSMVHIILTIILLWYAGKCGDRYCEYRNKKQSS